MKRYLLPAIMVLLLLGCGPDQEPEQPETSAGNSEVHSPDDRAVATVNGDVITESMLELHAMRRTGDSTRALATEQREMLLLELVEMALIAQDAHERALDEDLMLQAQMHNIQRALMAQALVEELKREPVPEEELTALYEQHFAGHREEEYHARHILVDEETKARELIQALQEGADFAELARQYSQGPYGPQGGDLGWFTVEQTLEPFGHAAAGLDVGGHTREPVRTQFGWHVIQLEDKRLREAPGMEEVRDRLVKMALKQRIHQHVAGLREQSEVRLFLPEE